MSAPGWNRLFDWLASLKLAVVLLIALAVAMAVGTVIDTHHGATAARHAVYAAWWFDTMMALLAVNVLFAALKRWPWRRRHLGFVVTHAGILVLLVGSFISRRYGVEGQLQLAEGESRQYIQQSSETLRVQVPDDGVQYTIEPEWIGGPAGGPPWRFRLGQSNTEVVVTERYPHATSVQQVSGDGERPNPALRFRLSGTMAGTVEDWLFAFDPAGRRLNLSLLEIAFQVCATSEEFEALIAPVQPPPADAPWGTLRVTLPDGETRSFDVQQTLESGPVAIPDSTWSLRLVEYLPHARLEGSKLLNAGEKPVNPFLRIHLVSPAGATEERLVFARFPDFDSLHGDTARGSGARLLFDFPENRAEDENELVLAQAPDGALLAVMPDDQGGRRAVPVTLGAPIRTPWADLSLVVTHFHERARAEQRWVPAGKGQGSPAVAVTIRDGDASGSGWAAWGFSASSIRVGEKLYRVALEPRRIDLGFTVKLLDFENPKYGGTGMAARYYSEVEVSDDRQAEGPQRHLISMNEPLDHGGFRIFQSGFQEPEGGPQISIFTVARDPGTGIVYLGCAIMVLGIALIFYLPSSRPREPAKAEI